MAAAHQLVLPGLCADCDGSGWVPLSPADWDWHGTPDRNPEWEEWLVWAEQAKPKKPCVSCSPYARQVA